MVCICSHIFSSILLKIHSIFLIFSSILLKIHSIFLIFPCYDITVRFFSYFYKMFSLNIFQKGFIKEIQQKYFLLDSFHLKMFLFFFEWEPVGYFWWIFGGSQLGGIKKQNYFFFIFIFRNFSKNGSLSRAEKP